MKGAGFITFFFGLIVLIGGIMGYVKAASFPSLIMGLSFGIILCLSAWGMFQDHLFPAYVGIILILALDAFFTYRWLLTYKFFPAGLMSIIGLIAFLAVAILIRNHLKR